MFTLLKSLRSHSAADSFLFRHLPSFAGVLLSIAVPCVQAQVLSSSSTPTHEGVWVTVADTKLDRMRGGFVFGGGLMVSLGIQQATYINGNLVTQTSIPLTQLSQLSIAQAIELRERLNTLTVVQNGAGNRWGNLESTPKHDTHAGAGAGAGAVSPTAGGGSDTVAQGGSASNPATTAPVVPPQVYHVVGAGAGTVIQNTMSNQSIENLMTIGIRSNALELMRSGNWMQSLRDNMNAFGGMR